MRTKREIRKLGIRKQTVRVLQTLSVEQLRQVAGGKPQKPVWTCPCTHF
jgi:hypothetical protein